jgi:uncharacterized membrane protein YfcA
MVPLLVLWAKLEQHHASGTSFAAIIPISVVGGLVYYFQAPKAQVDLAFAALLMLGSVLGVYLGARAVDRIPEKQLKVGLAVLLVIIGLKELLFP